jgi:hypothetical protein
MSPNPFHPDNLVPTWSEAAAILKGDSLGHEFHGNQFVNSAHATVAASFTISDKTHTPAERQARHEGLANFHAKRAAEVQGHITKNPNDANNPAREGIVRAHLDAVKAHIDAGDTPGYGSPSAAASEKANNLEVVVYPPAPILPHVSAENIYDGIKRKK